MALQLLRVLVLGVLAAAADDVPVEWSSVRTGLACVVPGADRLAPRRPPPPLDAADHRRPKLFTWTHDGVEVPAKRVSPNGTLEVKRKEGGAAGIYQCSVKHHGGLVLGLPVNLKFASLEKQFHVHPENATARAGQPFALSCDIDSSPAASISWLRDGDPLPANTRYHVLTNQLLITDVRKEDSGFYRCMATNTPMNKTRMSHRGRLQVEVSSEELAPSLLPLRHEESVLVERGSQVVLPCPVRGWPRPEVIWEHLLPGDRLAELEVTHEVLMVLPDDDQPGVYTCRIAGSAETKTFRVSVSEPVAITIPPAHREVIRASTVRFNCTATGSPDPGVSWYKDGQKLLLAGRAKLLKNSVDSRIDELVISTVTSEDAGIYQCFASNGHSVASAWAVLNVTGDGAPAPTAVRCEPVSSRAVALSWTHPESSRVVAYTVHVMSTDEKGSLQTYQPTTNTEEIVKVKGPLQQYRFQVRAYMQKSETDKNLASDMSDSVVCQGQGVPIKLSKLEDDRVLVSWREFAEQTPDVKEWRVQYKEDGGSVYNVTLDASVNNYTLVVPPSTTYSVRVLGTLSPVWLTQELSRVAWTPTSQAREHQDIGDVPSVPTDLELTDVTSHSLTMTWRCDDDVGHVYIVCYKKGEFTHEDCQESDKNILTIEGLEPDTDYTVRVQARVENRGPGGAFTAPVVARTGPVEKQHFKSITYKLVNSSHALISWGGPADSVYQVRYCAELKLPLDDWTTVQVKGNSLLIQITPLEVTYVMVSGFDPSENSNVLTIPPQDIHSDIRYEVTASGADVSWSGAAGDSYWVRYSQEIAQPVEKWPELHVDKPTVQLKGLDSAKPTYVMVTSTGNGKRTQVITIPAAQHVDNSLYLGVGVGVGVCVLALLFGAALCVWRRRKRSRSPVRSRRRNMSTNSNEEEGSEMKAMGGRLANGGASRGAGEPLLNGHVHITENPTVSKTPNGKPKKTPRYEPAFDVSRYDDPDTTLETVIDPDTSTSTQYNLLDTSRRPEYDSSRSSPRDVSANNSFTKLPDDNMNSELTRSTDYIQKDNSKAQPTLQPNG